MLVAYKKNRHDKGQDAKSQIIIREKRDFSRKLFYSLVAITEAIGFTPIH